MIPWPHLQGSPIFMEKCHLEHYYYLFQFMFTCAVGVLQLIQS